MCLKPAQRTRHRAPVAIVAPRGPGAWVVDLIPMRTVHRTGIVLALVLLGRSVCLAQSNDVYSSFTSASTPLTGYRVAVVSNSPVWVVGSAQNRFGIACD